MGPSIRLTVLLGTLAGASLLSGCAAVLLGGAAVGTAMVVTDRRTSGAQVDDQAIELKAVNRINEVLGERGRAIVTSFNRLVLITGEVPNEADKAAVEQAVSRIENVRSVVNELAIAPAASLGTRSSDTLITSKVKASLIDAKDLQVNAFKVVTERGVVYLMGRVTDREANRASDVSRGVSGVQKVVRVFEVVSEAELAGTQPTPPPVK
ncbi:MAG TPA: BON domain-containing protein [Burkholderiaceae bacterium]|nr:BON domain-containing protein [Burkholderiaceae bacterium]